jgi:AcrR family transcriptional regulator
MAPDRPYGGATAEDRRRDRRDRLIAAGLEEFGTTGYDNATVHAVAARAGVGDRYFYEHFVDRAALLEAVYEHVVTQVLGAATRATLESTGDARERVRAGITAFVTALTDDRRMARIQIVETVGRSPALEARRTEVFHAYASFIDGIARTVWKQPGLTDLDHRLSAIAVVGATNQLVIDWVGGAVDATREEIIDQLVRIYSAVATAPSAHRDSARST